MSIINQFKQCAVMIHDFFSPAKPEQILYGQKIFWPFLKYQQSWLDYVEPDHKFNVHSDPWQLLQSYMMPLIKSNASSYHLKGIELLRLDCEIKPEFVDFQNKFSTLSDGFEIYAVDRELEPGAYFELIRDKKFPCVTELRQPQALFCANAPDFWHEAIGHISALQNKTVQYFYLEIAEFLLASKSKKQFEERLTVCWTLMEFGFIKEKNELKMFGAALVGSHLANIRYMNQLFAIEPAKFETILASKFYNKQGNMPKNKEGKFRYFYMDNLGLSDFLLGT